MSSQTPNSNRRAGYEDFFGLKAAPFNLAPDPRFLFASASHSAALAEVAYAIDRREPIVLVTGEIGTGKTLLCRTVLQRLPRQIFVSTLDDPLLGPDDLLTQLARDFGVISSDRAPASPSARFELVQALHAFFRSLASIHAHAVVIVDEAQHLQPAVLEQLRLLSNNDDEQGTLLQIVLVGQTDVEPLLSRPELRQIQQRVSRRFRLEPLTRDEVHQYIEHRLARAREGASSAPGAAELAQALAQWEQYESVSFAPAAIDTIARVSEGVPRVVNLVCDRALEEAFAARSRVVDVTHVATAVNAVGLSEFAVEIPEPAAPVTPRRLPDAPFWAGTQADAVPASPAVQAEVPADAGDARDADVLTAAFGESAPKRSRVRARTLTVAAVAVVLASVGTWFGLRMAGQRRPAPAPRPAAATPALPPPAAVRRGAEPPAAPSVAAPQPEPASPLAEERAPVPATPAPAAPAPSSAAAATPPANGGFLVVVASFRTEARAAEVEGEIAKLGVPTRRRALGAWQQIVCGPFASRSAAEEAQQTLAKGGFTGTQISVSQ